jgi:hypothetical protein
VSMTVMWMWLAWGMSIAVTLIGTVVGLGWPGSAEARILCVVILGHAILVIAAAVCLTIQVFMQRQTRLLLGVMDAHSDAERRIRNLPVRQ